MLACWVHYLRLLKILHRTAKAVLFKATFISKRNNITDLFHLECANTAYSVSKHVSRKEERYGQLANEEALQTEQN